MPKIDPPSLLTMPVKNDIPVRVDLTWTHSNGCGGASQDYSVAVLSILLATLTPLKPLTYLAIPR